MLVGAAASVLSVGRVLEERNAGTLELFACVVNIKAGCCQADPVSLLVQEIVIVKGAHGEQYSAGCRLFRRPSFRRDRRSAFSSASPVCSHSSRPGSQQAAHL